MEVLALDAGATMDGSDSQPSPRGAVLAATDLSETANAGVRWALQVAGQGGSTLHLVHALNVAGWTSDFTELHSKVPVQLEDAARQHLDRMAQEAQHCGVAATWSVRIGQPSEVIVSEAQRLRAKLVVLGTSGLRPFDPVALGSTAERVVQRASCPVLTVHPEDPVPAERVTRILAATDFSDQASWALRTAVELVSASDSPPPKVVLLHVFHVPYEFSMDSIYGPATPVASVWEAVAREVDGRLARHAEALATDNGVEILPLSLNGYPPQIIVRQAAKEQVDWIVMGTHGRTGLSHVLLGSTAERVIQKAHCPVLTVRRPPGEPTPFKPERR